MSPINFFKGIYLDLDAILDTRLGVIKSLDNSLYEYYTNEGKEEYKNRIIDEFKYIPNKVFKYFYRNRTKEILQDSIVTPMLYVLNMSIDDMLTKRVLSEKTTKKLTIDINYYPYDLTEEEIEKLKGAVYTQIASKEFVIVNFISMPYEELSSSTVEKYGVMAMYDAMDWLDMRGLFKDVNVTLPSTHLILPYLLQKPIVFKSGENIEKYFKNIEELFTYYIKLEYNRMELFSFM